LIATLAGFVIVATAVIASYTDLRWQRIPNWLTYSAILWGFGINLYAKAAPSAAEYLGAVGISSSLAGFLAIFFLFLVVFSFTGGGAGDVKLAGAVGALFGLEAGMEVMIYAFAAAGVWIVSWAILSVGPMNIAKAIYRRLGRFFLPAWFAPLSEDDRAILTMPVALGPFFGLGMLTVLLGLNHSIEQFLTR
jgi:Flp pilus assembly protein protease CpaA